MKLRKEQIGAIFYHPDGSVIELSEDSSMLEKVFKVAPTLFEEEVKKPKKEAEKVEK